MPLFPYFSKVEGYEYEGYLPTAFDPSMSLLQKVNFIIGYFNKVLERNNEMTDYIDTNVTEQNKRIKELRDEFEAFKVSIEDKVIPENLLAILNTWFNDGTLSELINEQIFNMKADKTEVYKLLSDLQSGVKGTYATVADLRSALPNGDTGNYLVQADGHIYTYKNSAWTDTGIAFQSAGIADGSVSEQKTTFVQAYRNLFNPSALTDGYYYVSNGVVIESTTGTNVKKHPRIALQSGVTYTLTRQTSSFVYLVDGGNNVLRQLSVGTAGASFTTTQDCFLLITINSQLDFSNIMVVRGDRPEKYQPYNVVYKREILNLDLQEGSVKKEDTDFIGVYKNLFNVGALTAGYHYVDSNNKIIESSGGTNVLKHPKIRLLAGRTYSISKQTTSFVYLADAGNNMIKQLSLGSNGGTFIAPSDCYLFYTVNTQLSYDTIMIVEDKLPSQFYPYNVAYKTELKGITVNSTIQYKEIEVSKDGSKPFKTVTDAVNSVTTASEMNQVNIIIYDGVYEERDINLKNKDFVNLVGQSGIKENVEIRGTLPDSSTDAQINPSSTINMTSSNRLKDITVTARNMRYAIHDESNGDIKDWSKYIENCHIEHYGNEGARAYRRANGGNASTVWNSSNAWGAGASSGAYLLAKRSKFIAHDPQALAFSVHNNTDFAKPMLHELEECVIDSKQYGAIKVEGLLSGTNDRVIVKNCFINGNHYLTNALSISLEVSGSTLVPSNTTDYFSKNSHALYTEFTRTLLNNSGADIPKGTIVCMNTNEKTIRPMQENDSVDLLLGYTIGDTANGDYATVITNGFYRYTDDLTFGKKYGVANGKLSATATNKIGMATGNGFVKIKSPTV